MNQVRGIQNRITSIFCKIVIPLAVLLVIKLRLKNNNKSPFRRFLVWTAKVMTEVVYYGTLFINRFFYLYKSCPIVLKFADIFNEGPNFNPMQFMRKLSYILTPKTPLIGRLGGPEARMSTVSHCYRKLQF